MAKPEDYPLTLKEAARKLGISSNAVRRFAASQKLTAAKFGPLRELRFREEDLDEFLTGADPSKLHRRIVQRIKSMEPHYQGLSDPAR